MTGHVDAERKSKEQSKDKSKDKFKKHAEQERSRIEREEDEVTIQSDDSFPASDPPSFTPIKGPRGDKKKSFEH